MRLNLTAVRIEMAKKNISQKILAKKACLQAGTVCLILNGKSKGTPETWGKIAKALDVSVTELIEE